MQGTTVNGYRFVSLIGRGGMAEVWKAENGLGVCFAIKVLNANLSQDPAIVERFRSEAKIMVALNHPNIRKVIDLVNLSDGRPCIIMEYLEGADLASRMRQGERFTDAQLRKWWNQMVDVLNYTHSQGIIHRDIKPSNIFINESGDVKLLDFGIARTGDGLGTRTGSNMGTLMYMSPEQVTDVSRVSKMSDVYSLAVTFVHLASGKPPYDSALTEYTIMDSIVKTPLDTSALPEPWNSFLKPYLEKNPILRPDLKEIHFGTQSGMTTSYKSTSISNGETKIDEGRTKIENETKLELKVSAELKKLSNFPAKGDVTYIQVKTNGEPSLLVPKDSWISGSKMQSRNEGVYRYVLTVQKNTSPSWRKQDVKVVATYGNDTKEEALTIFQQKKTSLWWLWLILAIIGVIILVTAINKNKPTKNNYSTTQSTYQETTYTTHEYVDLGLPSGILWATCNVGASKPEDYGKYYAWGETTTKKSYTMDNYTYKSQPHKLPSNVDAATANWGAGWRTPTEAEFLELVNKCSWKWTGKGYKVTGPNGNSIFLPAAGYQDEKGGFDADITGAYWSSSYEGVTFVRILNFKSGSYSEYFCPNWWGLPIRPVHN